VSGTEHAGVHVAAAADAALLCVSIAAVSEALKAAAEGAAAVNHTPALAGVIAQVAAAAVFSGPESVDGVSGHHARAAIAAELALERTVAATDAGHAAAAAAATTTAPATNADAAAAPAPTLSQWAAELRARAAAADAEAGAAAARARTLTALACEGASAHACALCHRAFTSQAEVDGFVAVVRARAENELAAALAGTAAAAAAIRVQVLRRRAAAVDAAAAHLSRALALATDALPTAVTAAVHAAAAAQAARTAAAHATVLAAAALVPPAAAALVVAATAVSDAIAEVTAAAAAGTVIAAAVSVSEADALAYDWASSVSETAAAESQAEDTAAAAAAAAVSARLRHSAAVSTVTAAARARVDAAAAVARVSAAHARLEQSRGHVADAAAASAAAVVALAAASGESAAAAAAEKDLDTAVARVGEAGTATVDVMLDHFLEVARALVASELAFATGGSAPSSSSSGDGYDEFTGARAVAAAFATHASACTDAAESACAAAAADAAAGEQRHAAAEATRQLQLAQATERFGWACRDGAMRAAEAAAARTRWHQAQARASAAGGCGRRLLVDLRRLGRPNSGNGAGGWVSAPTSSSSSSAAAVAVGVVSPEEAAETAAVAVQAERECFSAAVAAAAAAAGASTAGASVNWEAARQLHASLHSGAIEARAQAEMQREAGRTAARALADPPLSGAERALRAATARGEALALALKDLERYARALDGAVMSFHHDKLARVNKALEEYWTDTYRGGDIERVLVRGDASDSAGASAVAGGSGGFAEGTKRKHHYRLVMVKDGKEMDMRGRCSAGQKVLVCLLVRLALAEVFCSQFNVLALDEPTTNLDTKNNEALAKALERLLRRRHAQRGFQLIVITHDRDFMENLRTSDFCDSYFFVQRDSKTYLSTISAKLLR
jgi:DNA repair protein RAD50